tara:strand:- start:2572 stop:3129 length:558 start_codon:yes stop_codon:yes gene_type:complete
MASLPALSTLSALSIDKDITFGSSVLVVSLISNILLWFSLKYFKQKENISTSTFFTLQFGLTWTFVTLIAVLIMFVGAGSNQTKNRASFVQDLKKISYKGYLLIVASVVIAIVGFYLVLEWFSRPVSGLSKFVPMRTSLAVIFLALIGIYYFKEKPNKFIIIGLCMLLIGFLLLFFGRFFNFQIK